MARTFQNEQALASAPIGPLMLRLAAPAVAAQLINVLYNIVDRIYIGHIAVVGKTALTGVGVTFPILTLISAFSAFAGMGGAPLASIRLGAGDRKGAEAILGSAVSMLVTMALVLTVGFSVFQRPLLLAFGASADTIGYATDYLTIYLLGTIFVQLSLGLNTFISAQGKAMPAMCSVLIGAVLNILLDPLFIFGLGMGTAGAGLATALSQTISFCILLSMFLRGKTVSQFRITAVTHSPAEFGTILMTGMPSFGRQGLNSIGGMLLNIAARGYGDAAVAGMSIVSRIFMFIISVAIGTGQGFQPVAGFNYGAKKYHRVQQACLFTMAASFCFLSVILTVCWFNAETLIRLFRDDPEVTAVALPAFRYQCFAMLLQPVIVAGNMLFQSIGKSGRATFLACCRQGVFFIPLILTLPRAFGLLGVEICQPIADVLTFFVNVPFLFPFLRQLVRMDEAEAAKA